MAIWTKIIFSDLASRFHFKRGFGGERDCQFCVNEDSDRDSVEGFRQMSMMNVDQPPFNMLTVESI